jgi:hypothetical protein
MFTIFVSSRAVIAARGFAYVPSAGKTECCFRVNESATAKKIDGQSIIIIYRHGI